MVIFSLFIILSSFIYCQCDEFSDSECDANPNCLWEENLVLQNCNTAQSELFCDNINECTWENQTTNYSCSNFGSSTSCAEFSDYGCSWEFSWGGWMSYGSSCVGGSFQVDNGVCSGGNYYIDLGVCEQLPMPSCSDMNQPQCDTTSDCEWVENIEISSCSSLSSNDCELVPECNYGCTEYDSWYTWLCVENGCTGGNYQINNSYCDDYIFFLGDINQDNIINIQDIILVIDLILNNEYNISADFNYDNTINVADIVQLVNLILN